MTKSLKIRVANRSDFQLDEGKAEHVAIEVLTALCYERGEVGINFVSGDEIEALNKKYLNRDGATDVLSFPIDADDDWPIADEGIPRLLGDIVICPETAARQASDLGSNLESEICLLIVHGILHLAGFDHETDKGEMDEKQAGFYKELCKQNT